MNIFLLGARGYLGSYISAHLDVDVEIKNKTYDYFINCAGKPDLEFCETNPDKSKESNYTVLMDTHSKIPEAKIISFSSYYVYDDLGVCKEDAYVTSEYSYTKHKLLSEKFVINKKGVCFRVGKLFGNISSKKNKKLTEIFINSSAITLDEVRFNPTSVAQVLKVIKWEIDTGELEGIYNLSNKGSCTHAEYGERIDKFLGTQTNITVVDRLPRDFHNYGRFEMDTSRLEKHVVLRPWEEDLEEYLRCIV